MNRVLAIFYAFFGFSITASAATYIVGVEDLDYLPHYSSKNGEYEGYGRDLLDAFAKDAGHELVYRSLPIKRLFRSLITGEIDLKYPDNVYWGIEMKQNAPVIYSEPVVGYIDGMVVKKEDVGKGKDHLKVIGTLRGFTPWEYMKDIDFGRITVSESGSYQALVSQLVKGRIDSVYANVDVVLYNLKEKGVLLFDESLPYTKSNYHLSTIEHRELMNQFNIWLKENTDKINLIKKKYNLQ